MSANNDNAMARFLFAILQQKNLKDIDWNAVANNKHLAQTISNGHAARMRYSRFRSSLLGIEPQRRNRTATSKSKVTKSKKETKTKTKKEKEEEEQQQQQQHIKPDPIATADAHREDSRTLSPQIKNEAIIKKETQQTCTNAPTEMPSFSMPEAQIQFHYNRLLTPCSDTDPIAASHAYAATCTSPVNQMLHSHHEPGPFDYAGVDQRHAAHGQMVPSPWQSSPSYSPGPLQTYQIDAFGDTAPFCDHQHHAVNHPDGLCIDPSAMMEPDHGHDPVKQEWSTHFC